MSHFHTLLEGANSQTEAQITKDQMWKNNLETLTDCSLLSQPQFLYLKQFRAFVQNNIPSVLFGLSPGCPNSILFCPKRSNSLMSAGKAL